MPLVELGTITITNESFRIEGCTFTEHKDGKLYRLEDIITYIKEHFNEEDWQPEIDWAVEFDAVYYDKVD